MAGRAGQKIKLTSIDELLCVPETEGTVDIDVRAIYPFENHPFKVLDDEKMDELVESIKANGVLTPVLVRPDDEGTYEMISGHRRLHAAKRAGLFRIPAIVKEMTNDEATIIMVDSKIIFIGPDFWQDKENPLFQWNSCIFSRNSHTHSHKILSFCKLFIAIGNTVQIKQSIINIGNNP